jgi:hypothetical protein
MSTTGYDSWAVDLADVGAFYPFQGTEVLLTIVGVAFWLIWHVWQIREENKTINEEEAKLRQPGALVDAVNKAAHRQDALE